MPTFIAQRGELCLLTLPGYIALMESPDFLPIAQAPWAADTDEVVGYIEGEVVYRLLDLATWGSLLKEYRQRQVDAALDRRRQRGLYAGTGPKTSRVP
jgi:hypothetical protein